jgi:protein gp37
MADQSKIEWCDSTFNPWIGCAKVGPGCLHCYAEVSTPSRALGIVWGAKSERHRTSEANWKMPKRWEREHEAFFAQHGRRRRVFCASLADVFDNQVPDSWRADLFRLIAATPHLDWLLVTKRIGNVPQMVMKANTDRFLANEGFSHGLPSNVWLGITIVNQEEADRDIPKLLAVPAHVRFLSMEPLLGPVDLAQAGAIWSDMNGIIKPEFQRPGRHLSWVIVGGESGTKARPMHAEWARSVRDQCEVARVPFLFKQWGEWLPWHQFVEAGVDDPAEQTRFRTMEWRDDRWVDVGFPGWMDTADGHVDDMECVGRVGKKAAGRLLDGIEHNGFPVGAEP